MKSNKLFESLNDIDEKIIEEAHIEEYTCQNKFSFMKVLIPIAAIVLFMILPGVLKDYINKEQIIEEINPPIIEKKPIGDEELPKISIGQFNTEGSGFEGLMAYDIKELVNENPWNENVEISTLPVFKNKLEYNERGILENPDIKAMRKRLDETIRLLKINPKEIEIRDDYPSEEEIKEITEKLELTGGELTDEFFNINQIYGENEKYEITVYNDLSTMIKFKAKDPLLKNYYIDYDSTYEDVYKTAQYVSEEYKNLLEMGEATINIYGGDYTYDGEQRFHISFFDGKGSLEDKIINYNLNYTEFFFDEEDKLGNVTINKPNLSQKIGNYPIISSKEAEKLLIDNKYITNVPKDFPGQEYIKKVELVYRGQYEENFVPYYLFYVELNEIQEDNGLKTYGAYYVPAVEGEYIDNMDIMDGKFN